jgi:hypothetical protein
VIARVIWAVEIEHDRPTPDAFWFQNGVAILVIASSIAAFLPPGLRWLRLATALPLAHAAAMVAVFVMWTQTVEHLERADAPWGDEAQAQIDHMFALAIGYALVAMAAAVTSAACRRRVIRTLDRILAVALVNLLLLGLWLPIASSAWSALVLDTKASWTLLGVWESHRVPLVAFVLLPPLVGALWWTAARRTRRRVTALVVGVLFAIAIACRIWATRAALSIYIHFSPTLVAAAFMAAIAVVVVGSSRHLARLRASRTHAAREGVIVDDGDRVVAAIEVASWVRGPTTTTTPFVVRTDRGNLHIPVGTEIVHAIPPDSVRLRLGEGLAILRAGDRVRVDGFVDPDPAHPFRDSLAPTPGPHIVVRPTERERGPRLGDITLSTWRPAIAYLAIVSAVVITALVAIRHVDARTCFTYNVAGKNVSYCYR